MGNWKIIICGTGCHHNKDAKIDANLIGFDLVNALADAGQNLQRAEFIVGAGTDDLLSDKCIRPQNNAEYQVLMNKRLRRDADELIQELKNLPPSRERSLAITKLQEAVMWMGMDLKRLNDEQPGLIENPYPNSKDPSNTMIEPTADGLKM